ncbi:S8 family serine peptidase [Caldanaerobacter subterraneus]|uniref:S8 family serine peptidase n=1 Tax=Caldanaerobacter subterraneus TaxID=911092 RepID=A0A7Y2L5Q6_9THEO|nr:S8 family serine peptidase [Caldanaerobacter subterraneus]NNG65707.1 S8 family serine peptidase [Caldanaerobacter subterraneus]
MWKRLLVFLVAFTLVFSVFGTFGYSQSFTTQASKNVSVDSLKIDEAALKQIAKSKFVEKLQPYQPKSKASDKAGNQIEYLGDGTQQEIEKYSPEQYVRVIIELKEDSLASYAVKADKTLKTLKEAEKQAVLAKIDETQAAVKNTLIQKFGFIPRHTYKTVLNGLSGQIKVKDIEKIKLLPQVKDVRIVHEYFLDMTSAVWSTNAPTVWEELGYKGEGMVVAIVDTGIDYRHQDMKITDPSKAKLTKEKVQEIASKMGLPYKYFTDKVPVGWNWADNNDEILDIGATASMHGQHVAGIVAANGQIKGVAPEAQLIAEKVFSNNPYFASAFSDDIVAGIDHAVAFGADVINMSLGATAGFVREDDPENLAIKRAVENGVIVVVSAGNSAYSTKAEFYPYAIDPDIGTVGSPGLFLDTIQVAASVNPGLTGKSFLVTPAPKDFDRVVYLVGSPSDHAPIDPADVLKDEYEVVYCGLGRPEDFQGKDLTGKVALISRGAITFNAKTINAQNAGAVAAIIFNNTSGTISMALGEGTKIPAVSILQSAGLAIKALLDQGQTVKVKFDGKVATNNLGRPPGDTVTDFSSWGVTPSFDFKPEIMAPGGGIYSTVNKDSYEVMSGTSMSAPHVSGAMALIAQALKGKVAKGELNLKGRDFVEMAKVMAMNTAKVIIDPTTSYGRVPNYPYSPRQQGAGMIQIDKAIKTPVVVTDVKGKAGIALGSIGNSVTFTLVLRNFGNSDVTYNLKDKYGVLTDQVLAGYNLTHTAPLTGAVVTFDKDTVTVPANGQETVNVTLIIPQNAPRNIFAEGYISFVPQGSDVPELTVPYTAFYGNWDEPRVIDSPMWDEDTYYGYTGMAGEMNGELYFLGNIASENPDPGTIAISPNGDGIFDYVQPVLSFLRNARELRINVVDSNGNVVREISQEEYIRKNVAETSKARISDSWIWDGKVYNAINGKFEVAPDGQYYMRFESKIDYPNARTQVLEMPVKVDTIPPGVYINPDYIDEDGYLKDIYIADGKATIKWEGKDEGSGINSYVLITGKIDPVTFEVTNIDGELLPNDVNEAVIELPYRYTFIAILGIDYAGNVSDGIPGQNLVIGFNADIKDNFGPVINVIRPQPAEIFNTREIVVEGTIESGYTFGGLYINGERVSVDENNHFMTILHFDTDGRHKIEFLAYDDLYDENDPSTYEHKTEFAIPIYIDTTIPEITLNIDNFKGYISPEGRVSLTVAGSVYDTGFGYKLYVNGNIVLNKEADEYTTLEDPFEVRVPLNVGPNNILVKAIDVATNKSEVTVSADVYTSDTENYVKVSYGDKQITIPLEKVTLDSLKATPNPVYIPVGREASVKVDAVYTDGSTKDVTDKAVFEVVYGESAVLDKDVKGVIIGVNEGETTIKATYEDKSVEIKVVVSEAVPVGITVEPSEIKVPAGRTESLKVYNILSNGKKEEVTHYAKYKVKNENIAQCDRGIVRGISKGNTILIVEYLKGYAEVPITVTDPILENITVKPSSIEIKVGETAKLTVTAYYSDSATKDVTANAQYNFDSNIIAVDKGVVKGLRAGNTTIIVSYDGKSTEVGVTVKEITPPPGEGIIPPPAPVTPPAGTEQPKETPKAEEASQGKVVVEGNTTVLVVEENKVANEIKDATKKEVVFDLTNVGDTSSKAIEVPVKVLNMIAENNKNVVVKSGEVALSIDPKAMTVSEETLNLINKTGSVKLVVEDKGKKVANSLIPVSNAYDITIKAGENKIKIDSPVKVTFEVKDVKDIRKVGIYYLNEVTGKWEYVGGKIDKNANTITFEAKHFSTYGAFEYDKQFKDVGKDFWAYDVINVLASRHIIKGMDDDNFAPNAKITRAQFAALMIRALGIEEKPYKGEFEDVKEGAWYANAIEAAYQEGIMLGDGKKMRPDDPITREEMAAVIMRVYSKLAGYKEENIGNTTFADNNKISEWARNVVANAVKLGIVRGYDDNTFKPKDNATRAEAAAMLYRILEKSGNM